VGSSSDATAEGRASGVGGAALRWFAPDRKCVGCSVANGLVDEDEEAARAASAWPDRVIFTGNQVDLAKQPPKDHVGVLVAALPGRRWMTKDTGTKKGFYDKHGRHRNNDRLLEWFLSPEAPPPPGKYFAILRDIKQVVEHCILIVIPSDGPATPPRGVIFDPSREEDVFQLTRDSFNLFVPDGRTCAGVARARKLVRRSSIAEPTPRKPAFPIDDDDDAPPPPPDGGARDGGAPVDSPGCAETGRPCNLRASRAGTTPRTSSAAATRHSRSRSRPRSSNKRGG